MGKPEGEITIEIRVDTRWSRYWLLFLQAVGPALLPFVGEERLLRWASAGAVRLMRVRW